MAESYISTKKALDLSRKLKQSKTISVILSTTPEVKLEGVESEKKVSKGIQKRQVESEREIK
jgi:hypothetical protein